MKLKIEEMAVIILSAILIFLMVKVVIPSKKDILKSSLIKIQIENERLDYTIKKYKLKEYKAEEGSLTLKLNFPKEIKDKLLLNQLLNSE